jgi:SOS response regulatory protein OraA/RecX
MSRRREIASALWLAAAGVGALYVVLVSTFDHSADPGAARANIFVTLLPTWPILIVGAVAIALFVAGAVLTLARKPITPASRPAESALAGAERVEAGSSVSARTSRQLGAPANERVAATIAPPAKALTPAPQESATPSPAMTLGQENALRSAKEYLRMSGFSRSGLVHQLKHEGFSADEARIAVEAADPDWLDQAINAAKSYISSASFSRRSLVEQLNHDGFSDHDATAAADAVSTDWNRQAARSAADYLATSSFSRQSLFEQLEHEGFTHDQIDFGLSEVGY